MNTGIVALLFGLGAGAWIYNKTSQRTGNNLRTSLITAAFIGLIAAFVFYTLFRLTFSK